MTTLLKNFIVYIQNKKKQEKIDQQLVEKWIRQNKPRYLRQVKKVARKRHVTIHRACAIVDQQILNSIKRRRAA